MQILFAPWRYKYVKNCDERRKCVFCEMSASSEDEVNLILYRGELNFVVLNRYPYVTGHLMIVPFRHLSHPGDTTVKELSEMMSLTIFALKGLKIHYKPHGFNMGMNIGQAAGAGIEDHIHMHVVPRWTGDTNFMSVVGETRIIPEDLSNTFGKLRSYFSDVMRNKE